MPMRFARSSTSALMVWPWTTTKPWSRVVEQEWLADPAKVGLASAARARRPGGCRHGRTDNRRSGRYRRSSRGTRHARLGIAARMAARIAASSTRAERCRIDAVALEALRCRRTAATCDQRAIAAENAQQHLLMIAEQEHRAHARAGDRSAAARPPGPSAARGRSGRRRRPARLLRAGRRLRGRASIFAEQLVEQVEPPVDVADDIGAVAAGRPLGGPRCLASMAKNANHASPNVRPQRQASPTRRDTPDERSPRETRRSILARPAGPSVCARSAAG